MPRTQKTVIIVPVWNQLSYTKAFIQSIYRNTDHAAFELVIVDNDSKDKTPKYLRKISQVYKNLKVITNPTNLGYVGGINTGLAYVDTLSEKPDYVLFGNNDVEVTEQWLPKMQRYFDEYDNLGAIGPVSDNVSGPQHLQWQYNFGSEFQVVKYLIGFWMLVKYSVYEQVGKLDDSFGKGFSDDIDYSIRIRKLAFSKKHKYMLGIARDTTVFHDASASYKHLHTSQEDYKKDLEEKHAILVKKWGKKVIEDTMKVVYFHGTVIVPTKEFVSTPFAFSCINLFNTSPLKLMLYNGKTSMLLKSKSEGLKEANGEFTLILHDHAYFPGDIITQAKDYCTEKKLQALFMPYPNHQGYGAIFIMNEIIPQLDQPYFMSSLEVHEDDLFMEQLKEKGIPYEIYDGISIQRDTEVEEGTVLVSMPADGVTPDGTIGIPAVENMHNVFTVAMLSLLYAATKPYKVIVPYNLPVDRARNAVVAQREGKYVWFIDSDQTFNVNILENLLQAEKPVITGVVYKKIAPYGACIYEKDKETYGYKHVLFPLKERYYTVDMCGTGCLLVQNAVFDRLKDKQPYFWYNDKHGEDIHFIEKVRDAGYEVWVDSALPIGHTTLVEIGAEDFMRHNFPSEAHKVQFTNIAPAHA